MASITLSDIQRMDAEDPLAHHRAAFNLPAGVIYLDGNSLGPPPNATAPALNALITEAWGRGLIRSWTSAGWMDAPARIGAKIAPIIGAAPDEVIIADSTSVTLFKLAAAGCRLRQGRPEILIEADNFPTDRHIVDGLATLIPGLTVRTVPPEAIAEAIGPRTACCVLCHVHYRSGVRHDMQAITQAAHAAGALAIWDLSHSAGAIPVHLNAAEADMAVGCGYKFLNGGPGAPAFAYVARHLQEAARSPIQGWIGHAAPFGFSDIYEPAPGMHRFLTGTPGILGLTALEAGIDHFRTADRSHLWAKSARMFDLFAELAAEYCPALQLLTPGNPAHRGSHISFRDPKAEAVMQRLVAQGIIGDYRPPNVLRFGLTPLYTRFEDIWHAVAALAKAGVHAGATRL
jgi:kynureninase